MKSPLRLALRAFALAVPFASAAALANSPRSRADIRGAATLLIVR